jgi:hypothetical protein
MILCQPATLFRIRWSQTIKLLKKRNENKLQMIVDHQITVGNGIKKFVDGRRPSNYCKTQ